jgi:hypothetical protein
VLRRPRVRLKIIWIGDTPFLASQKSPGRFRPGLFIFEIFKIRFANSSAEDVAES